MPKASIRPIRVVGEIAYVELNTGKEVMIDAADAHLVKGYNWTEHKKSRVSYALRNGKIDGEWRTVLMHRAIANPPFGFVVDHINGDGLDNRRSNLRIATPSQNRVNAPRQSNNTSGYKGVSWNPVAKKWTASIGFERRNKNLGYFDTPEQAYAVYCEASAKIHGAFSRVA